MSAGTRNAASTILSCLVFKLLSGTGTHLRRLVLVSVESSRIVNSLLACIGRLETPVEGSGQALNGRRSFGNGTV